MAAVCRRVKGGIFFFLLNGKRWVSCSDEPALHQVLVILGVCAQLPHCVRSWQETLCGDTLSLGPGPERRKCFFTVTFEYYVLEDLGCCVISYHKPISGLSYDSHSLYILL